MNRLPPMHEVWDRLRRRDVLPWRWTYLGGFVNTMLLVERRRQKMRQYLARYVAPLPDIVTVIIGLRNRADHKLFNTLKSLRLQDYPQQMIVPVVIDYDNRPEVAETIRTACQEFDAKYVRIDGRPIWSKPHCYNIGVKRARTKFLLSSDADILFAPNYVSTAVELLKERPLTAVYSQMLDLPEKLNADLVRWSSAGTADDIETFRQHATPRSSGVTNEGINATYTYFYQRIRGYDEFYQEWGTEDNDLQKRFRNLGLEIATVKDATFYLHQWHAKYDALDPQKVERAHRRNQAYYQRMQSIQRNARGWGELEQEIAL